MLALLTLLDVFSITGRGTVVVLDGATGLPVGRALSARLSRPDGTSLEATAYKEYVLRRASPFEETEAFLLMTVAVEQVPIGSRLEIADP